MIYEIKSSLASDILTKLRDKNTKHRDFQRLMGNLGLILGSEATKDLEKRAKQIETPLEKMDGVEIKNPVVILPILRAGLSIAQKVYELIDGSYMGHIGLYRYEEGPELKIVQYYEKLPQITKDSDVLICDPMIGTGGSLNKCIKILKEKYKPNSIKVLAAIAYEGALKKLDEEFPEIDFYIGGVDKTLNNINYIVPGLGDAGDRSFGTNE